VQEKKTLTIWKTFNFSASKHWFGWTSTSHQVTFTCLVFILVFIHASTIGTMRYLSYIQSISLHGDIHFNICEVTLIVTIDTSMDLCTMCKVKALRIIIAP
jgi:hypothetical protein